MNKIICKLGSYISHLLHFFESIEVVKAFENKTIIFPVSSYSKVGAPELSALAS